MVVRTFSWLVVAFVIFSACASRPASVRSDAARDAANALLVMLFETYPPKGRIPCVNILIGPEGTWNRLDTRATLQYLESRGIAAYDAADCHQIPPPADTAGDWSAVGEIFHTKTGRAAASYGVRVVHVTADRVTLHGGFAFNRRHGGSCPYEARLVGAAWIVRERTDEPCIAM